MRELSPRLDRVANLAHDLYQAEVSEGPIAEDVAWFTVAMHLFAVGLTLGAERPEVGRLLAFECAGVESNNDVSHGVALALLAHQAGEIAGGDPLP